MRLRRTVVSVTIAGVLAATVLSGGPALASSDPVGPPRVTAGDLPDVPVKLPSLRVLSIGASSLAVGQVLEFAWADQRLDSSLNAYYTVLDVAGAVAGDSYQLTLSGAGDLSAFVLDGLGDVVAYAAHPDAAVAAPTLEWEFADGDRLLLVSDERPLAAPTAQVRLWPLGSVDMPWLPTWPLEGGPGGELKPTDPHIPYHGGHVDMGWTRPQEATAGRDQIVLAFEGSKADTDWLSVVVLDSARVPVQEIPVESGMATFRLPAGQSFVVTSWEPDEFGSYAFQWIMPGTPEVAGVGDPGAWKPGDIPSYRVNWRWSTKSPALSSGMFPAERLRHTIEVSADGRTWKPGVIARPAWDVLSDGTSVVLADGSHQLRVVTQVGTVRSVSAAFPFQATGDDAGWRITGLRLAKPPLLDIPGEEPDLLDLRHAVTATQVYRDGRTRTKVLDRAPAARFQFETGEWRHYGEDLPWLSAPGNGAMRVESKDGKVRSNVVRVVIPKATGKYRATMAQPTRSTTVGGAMVFTGRLSRQYDDKWRPVHHHTSYRIQRLSGNKWVTIFSGRTQVKATGGFQATVPLAGSGTYRLVASTKPVATWKLSPAKATKTATVTKPSVGKSGKDRLKVGVEIRQRFADGRWGPGWSGWKYQVQYRTAGTSTWRATTRAAVTQSAPFVTTLKAGGKVEVRIKATYKGKTYYSPITKA